MGNMLGVRTFRIQIDLVSFVGCVMMEEGRLLSTGK